ncbi:MAG TPA: ABC transporter substrate-binding protein, partial [Enteractinococcus sp.]
DQLPGEDNEAFVEEFRETYDFTDPIPVVAAVSYHAAQYIGAAVEAAGSTDPEAISEQMPQVDIGGLMGSSSFDESNHTFSTQMYLFEIGADGEYTQIEDFGIVSDPMEKDCS